LKKIVHTDEVCGGEPRIEGTRLTCSAVAAMLFFQKMGLEAFLELYPYLTADDVWNCIDYCSRRKCVDDAPTNFCQGCVLDKREDDSPAKFISSLEEIDKNDRQEKGYIFLGNVREYLEAEEKEKFWEIAQNLKENLFRANDKNNPSLEP
jgi:uncharacterized protein (DUF433 family)